jgi:hypothetical protein
MQDLAELCERFAKAVHSEMVDRLTEERLLYFNADKMGPRDPQPGEWDSPYLYGYECGTRYDSLVFQAEDGKRHALCRLATSAAIPDYRTRISTDEDLASLFSIVANALSGEIEKALKTKDVLPVETMAPAKACSLWIETAIANDTSTELFVHARVFAGKELEDDI